MKLIIGLGNPGAKYEQTRHNCGFLAVDAIARDENFSAWKQAARYDSLIATGKILSEKVCLAKPQTFMNQSGLAVKKLLRSYRLMAHDLLVIHDDIDLPVGSIRISQSISAAGHKGIQSIIDQVRTQDFIRYRIGIAGPTRRDRSAEEFVLEKFSTDEKSQIQNATAQVIEAIEQTLGLGVLAAMNEFN